MLWGPSGGAPAAVWTTFPGLDRFSPSSRPKTAFGSPKSGQDRQLRPQERPKTANRGPKIANIDSKSGQDRKHRLQELPKTANVAPKSGPRVPT